MCICCIWVQLDLHHLTLNTSQHTLISSLRAILCDLHQQCLMLELLVSLSALRGMAVPSVTCRCVVSRASRRSRRSAAVAGGSPGSCSGRHDALVPPYTPDCCTYWCPQRTRARLRDSLTARCLSARDSMSSHHVCCKIDQSYRQRSF